nr:MAG TPA: Sarcoplasmic/endoplasmic reticulum calcium ATPase 1-ATPase, SERCA1a, membrane protein.51A [Caudoviricetes sp.]
MLYSPFSFITVCMLYIYILLLSYYYTNYYFIRV